MSATNPDTEDLKSEKTTSLSVSRLTDVPVPIFQNCSVNASGSTAALRTQKLMNSCCLLK